MSNELGQFWLDVIEAHDKVSVNHELVVGVARDGKEAQISFNPDVDAVVIYIIEIDTETRDALLVPGGGD